MSVRRRMKDRVVIETPSLLAANHVNEYGDEDESNAGYWDVSAEVRAYVTPTGSNELDEDRETVVRSFDMYLEPQTAIDANCRVRYIVSEDVELTCRVLGAPITYRNSGGRATHTLVKLEVVEG